jgi:predicted Kef-type K+ transport protein
VSGRALAVWLLRQLDPWPNPLPLVGVVVYFFGLGLNLWHHEWITSGWQLVAGALFALLVVTVHIAAELSRELDWLLDRKGFERVPR